MSNRIEDILYHRYMNLFYRCYKPGAKGYANNGALGITLCDDWIGNEGYKNFKKWAMNNGFSSELRLHRYDNSLCYSPDNCFWGTSMKVTVGEKYGRLTVVKVIKPYYSKQGNLRDYYFDCVCECGKHTSATGGNIKGGKVKSCGCLRKEVLDKKTHGESKTPLYLHFVHMRQRCNVKNKDNPLYKSWAGRGIKVCDEWSSADCYPNFKEWALSHGYEDGLSLERIDVNGDYSPENCKWIYRGEQQYNKTCTIRIGDKSLAKLAREHGINPRLANARYKAGWDIRDILNVKPGGKRRYEKRQEVNAL